MELTTNMSMSRFSQVSGPSKFPSVSPAKAIADKAIRENANLKQQVLRINAAKEAALKNASLSEEALKAAKSDLADAYRTIGILRQKVDELTASLDEAKAALAKKQPKKEFKKPYDQGAASSSPEA